MTPEQTVLAQAWADVFADGVATTMVLDEAWAYVNTLRARIGRARRRCSCGS